jgi:hypothetical protein
MLQVFLFAGLSVICLLAASSSPAAAEDRYCLQGTEWGYPGNCQFSTYSQCMATASGTDAYCGINPRYAFTHERSRPSSRLP